MKLAIGCDEAAYDLKVQIIELLEEKGYEVTDFGSGPGEAILYPEVGIKVAEAVASKEFERAILICGTGIGMSISANKVPGVRAAVCHDIYSAERSRKSNNAQIMCMGARVIGAELAKSLVSVWLECEFSGGRSLPKTQKIDDYEKENFNNLDRIEAIKKTLN